MSKLPYIVLFTFVVFTFFQNSVYNASFNHTISTYSRFPIQCDFKFSIVQYSKIPHAMRLTIFKFSMFQDSVHSAIFDFQFKFSDLKILILTLFF